MNQSSAPAVSSTDLSTLPSTLPSTPSRQWSEIVRVDEAARHAGYAEQFKAMQARKSAKYGAGRALHRKQLLGLRAELETHADLPAYARHGLFAEPRRFETYIRLSNGGTDRARDKAPDIRGFALQVRGVSGPSALGEGLTKEQDFLLINHSAFAFPTSHQFVDLVMAAARGPLSLITHFIKRDGLIGAFRSIQQLQTTFGKPFSGFATETFYTAAPFCVGPYAARLRLSSETAPLPSAGRVDWRDNFLRYLQSGPLRYRLALQFFVNERQTPIEDASVDWAETAAPYVDVATLTIPSQTPDAAFEAEIERATFDPWKALLDHRPLGEVMRARKVVYFASQQQRAGS